MKARRYKIDTKIIKLRKDITDRHRRERKDEQPSQVVTYTAKYPKNANDWLLNRQNWLQQAGEVKCTYAKVYLPDTDGTIQEFWSFNGSLGADAVVLYDYPIAELDWYSRCPIARLTSKAILSEDNLLSKATFHVGILTMEAIEQIVNRTGGRGEKIDALINTEGVVLYKPAAFVWDAVGTWKDGKQEKKSNNSLLTLLGAAGLILG